MLGRFVRRDLLLCPSSVYPLTERAVSFWCPSPSFTSKGVDLSRVDLFHQPFQALWFHSLFQSFGQFVLWQVLPVNPHIREEQQIRQVGFAVWMNCRS